MLKTTKNIIIKTIKEYNFIDNHIEIISCFTQYKINHLEKQSRQIINQTIKSDYIVVCQNESYVDISNVKEKYNFIHVKSDYNKNNLGRFSSCFTFSVDI